MKKIMFSTQFGLDQAVIERRKTMMRKLVGDRMTEDDIRAYFKGYTELADKAAPYKIGEVVAVAQCYEDAILDVGEEKWNKIHKWYNIKYLCHEKGLHNKMLVRADLMPHQIKITDIKVERLQDCSDDDILKEGIFQISAPIYRHYNGIGYTFKGWTDRGVECSSDTPKGAFKALIDKINGKGTWQKNPYTFTYTFELVK